MRAGNIVGRLPPLRVLGRIMVVKELLNFFLLRRQHDAMPLHDPRALTIFGHDVGTLVEHLDQAVRFCAFESEGRKRLMVLLHRLPFRIADAGRKLQSRRNHKLFQVR